LAYPNPQTQTDTQHTFKRHFRDPIPVKRRQETCAGSRLRYGASRKPGCGQECDQSYRAASRVCGRLRDQTGTWVQLNLPERIAK